ncbi:MAG: glycosyltransferase family 2 protein [Candidatus Dormibacteria bacterium]
MSTALPNRRVCIIIPAFNEQDSVRSVVGEVRRHMPAAEVLVIDDGSSDATAANASSAGATVIHLPVNLGIGGAVQAGYIYALRRHFDLAVQVDGDGQHDPEELTRLLAPLLSGEADLVIGSRWLGRGDYSGSRARRIGMRILARFVRWKTGLVLTDPTSGFRAVDSIGLELFARRYPADFPEVEALLIANRAGLRVVEVPVRMRPRLHGRSSISGLRAAYYMLRVSTAVVLQPVGGKRHR